MSFLQDLINKSQSPIFKQMTDGNKIVPFNVSVDLMRELLQDHATQQVSDDTNFKYIYYRDGLHVMAVDVEGSSWNRMGGFDQVRMTTSVHVGDEGFDFDFQVNFITSEIKSYGTRPKDPKVEFLGYTLTGEIINKP